MPKRGRDYSPVEIDKALTVLAYYGGNSARASKETGVDDGLLRQWRLYRHRERYQQLAEREAPALEAMAAQQARETIIRAGHAEHEILDVLHDRLDDAKTDPPNFDDYEDPGAFKAAYDTWAKRSDTKTLSELTGALQRLTTSKGINGTKLLELTGRPTQIIAHEDPREAGIRLARKYGITIEGTATELPATPLVTESDSANTRELVVSNPPD